jgi:hypothetical protein
MLHMSYALKTDLVYNTYVNWNKYIPEQMSVVLYKKKVFIQYKSIQMGSFIRHNKTESICQVLTEEKLDKISAKLEHSL